MFMFSLSDAKSIKDRMVELEKRMKAEGKYTPEEKTACELLYHYFCSSAEQACNSYEDEAYDLFTQKVERGLESLNSRELEKMKENDPMTYGAYEIMRGKTSKFEAYCVYAKIMESMTAVSDIFNS